MPLAPEPVTQGPTGEPLAGSDLDGLIKPGKRPPARRAGWLHLMRLAGTGLGSWFDGLRLAETVSLYHSLPVNPTQTQSSQSNSAHRPVPGPRRLQCMIALGRPCAGLSPSQDEHESLYRDAELQACWLLSPPRPPTRSSPGPRRVRYWSRSPAASCCPPQESSQSHPGRSPGRCRWQPPLDSGTELYRVARL